MKASEPALQGAVTVAISWLAARLGVLTGLLTVKQAYYKPSSLTEIGNNSTGAYYISVYVSPPNRLAAGYTGLKCNVATRASRSAANISQYGYIVYANSNVQNIYIEASPNVYSSYDAFKQALFNAGIEFVYDLETPATYQLTPHQVTALLGQTNVWADCGPVTVEYGEFPGALQRELPRAFETYYITTGQLKDATLGDNATAEGYNTTSSGDFSHAEGYSTVADGWGYGAHAEGANTHATGYFSHAEGINTLASGADPSVPEYDVKNGGSHAEGYGTTAGGEQSHAEGRDTTAAGNAAHAEGRDSSAGGDYSHAEGRNTDAVGQASHAEGYDCQALKSGSHAEGNRTIADGPCQHVFGQYNVSDTTSVEIVGWGTSSTRKNIRTLDASGNMTIAGTLTQSSDSRLKTIDGEIPDVSGVHAVRFRWNDENGTHDDDDHVGYIAQEVEKLAPFMVKEDSNGYKALDYIALLCAKMELLERRVAEMEKKGR